MDAVHEAHEVANEATEARVVASEGEIGKDQAGVIERQAEREQAKEQIALDDSVIEAAKSFDDLFPPKKGSE